MNVVPASLFFLVLVIATMPAKAQNPSPPPPPASPGAAEALAAAGNFREATDMGKALLKPEAKLATVEKAKLLNLVTQWLLRLDAPAEAEQVLANSVTQYSQEWLILLNAAESLGELPSYGSIIDGTFVRGERRGQGRRVQTEVRDHAQRLLWLEQARSVLPADTPAPDRAALWDALAQALMSEQRNFGYRPRRFAPNGSAASSTNAWRLLARTDLSGQLPEYDDETGLDGEASGYPVDAENNPIFFGVPATWEGAANDGERLRWALEQMSECGPQQAQNARSALANLSQGWFGVGNLAAHGISFSTDDDEGARREGISALHTLKDNETVTQLATGPRRINLPPDWAFLERFRAIAEDAGAPRDLRRSSWKAIAGELLNRRQYPRAAEALDKALEYADDAAERNSVSNQLEQIRAPQGRFEPQPPHPAGKEAVLSLIFRNAEKVNLTARKINIQKLLADTEAYLRGNPQRLDWQQINVQSIGQRLLEEGGEKYLGPVEQKWERALEPRPNHWDRRIDLPTPLKSAGAWWIEAGFPGGKVARTLVWIQDVVIVQVSQPEAKLYMVADAVTGVPIANAKVRFFGWRHEWQDRRGARDAPRIIYEHRDRQTKTNNDGQAHFSGNDAANFQWLITATTPDGRHTFLGFESFWYGGTAEVFAPRTRLYTITDRPVYRPGQEVKWKAWARRVGYAGEFDTNAFKGAGVRIVIQDPRGEKLLEKVFPADDSGAIGDTLVLGSEATLGVYGMSMNLVKTGEHLGGHQFRVEEYKKPEFEVKIDAPATPVALGDSFEVKVKADYYFGGPVKQGLVKYKVRRTAHTDQWFPAMPWDWLFGSGYAWRGRMYDWYPGSANWCRCLPAWPWRPRHSDPPELVASGESPLNADGTYTIKMDTALAKELHGEQDHKYQIEAEVTDQSRRTIFGQGSVLAARKPYEVYVWLDRGFYREGESGGVRVTARTLDGRTVTAEGLLKVLRVNYDKDGKPSEEQVAAFPIKTGDEEVRQQLTWARAGQYRVSCKLKDGAGHEIEGVAFTTVSGAGFNEGRDFRFDDLELVLRKNEYAPGEEVELTLNTAREGSTVALFVRPQEGAYPDPVILRLDGKSSVYKFTLKDEDQPNIFVEAFTISDARLHQATQQVIVPPKKRIATVELTPDTATYLPRQTSSVKVRVRDQDDKPFTGKVVLTAYDKALEYISGGSNIEDIRPFFWGWKRDHQPQVGDSLKRSENNMVRPGEVPMYPLGAFGNTADEVASRGSTVETLGGMDVSRSASMELAGDPFMAAAAMPAAAPQSGVSELRKELDNFADSIGSAAISQVGTLPLIRSNLADSAVWIADLTTDANGEGAITFAMPDNLTTWKLRAWVMGPQTQVGEANVEVVTRKNLMVRLQAPRFFVEKDEVVLSANVHNEMDESQDVRALLELEGGVLELMKDVAPEASATIAAHGEKRFDWRVKATSEGEAKVRVKALAQKDSDAMEMIFPVYVHGMLKTDTWSLALRPADASGSVKFNVPADRKPDQTRLEVRYSPTLAMAMIDALPYLVDYPYGCTEQTLNRFVPTVVTLRVLKDLGVNLEDLKVKHTNLNAQQLGDPRKRPQPPRIAKKVPIFDEDEVLKMARTGVDRLTGMRGEDGAWGWFPGGREYSPYITAVVLHGLRTAERAGIDVNDGVIRGAVGRLRAHEAEQLQLLRLPANDKHHKALPDNLDAIIHSVLVEHGAGDAAMRRLLYENRNHLSRYNVALLGLACHQVKETERRNMCLRNLRQFLKQDDANQTAWLELPANAWWWFWYEDQIETQAAFLRLLSAAEPKGETAARLAKYLLNNRRNATYWNSTKDTAAVIEALADFIKASGESQPNLKVEIVIDGEIKKSVQITPENLFTFDGTVIMEGEALETGEHTVELRKAGPSPLYSSVYLTLFSREDMIPAAGLEIQVRRKFYRLIEEKPERQVAGSRGQVVNQTGLKYRREEIASDAPIASGDLIEVELSIDSKNDYEYIIIEDMKPAGFEPVQVRSGWNWEGLPTYQEFRDERVAFFAERLPRGTHNLSYRVKAEIPGRFSALPTKAAAMYAPELMGNSHEWKARVEEVSR